MTSGCLFFADCTQNAKNSTYRHKLSISCLNDLESVARYDHISAYCQNGHRSKDDYISDNMMIMDVDNTHSDDPEDWYTPDDVSEVFPGVEFYIIYSRNHMKQKRKGNIVYEPRPKFHIYFPMKTQSEKYDDAEKLRKQVLAYFPVFDQKCGDPVHFFFGVSDAHGEEYEETLTIDEFIRDKWAENPNIFQQNLESAYNAGDDAEKDRLNSLFKYFEWSVPGDKEPLSSRPDYIESEKNAVNKEQWIENFMDQFKIQYKKGKSGAVIQYYVPCPWSDQHTSGDDTAKISILEDGKYGFKCHHDHCSGKHFRDWRRFYDPDFDSPERLGKWYYTITTKDGNEVIIIHKFAEYLNQVLHVKRFSNQLHIFKDGCYKTGTLQIEHEIYKREPELKANSRTEITKYLEVLNPVSADIDESNTDYIYCDDQYINWKTGEVLEPTPDIVIQNRIPYKYNAEAYYEPLSRAIDAWCLDQECRDLLEEAVGSCLYRSSKLQTSFILVGDGANGKSTFLNCLKKLLGDENISQLDIAELAGRFSTASLVSKLANIGDDISSEYLQGMQISIFKKLVTGNGIKGEKKGKDEFFFQSYAKLFFSANEIPKMSTDSQKSISRRLVIIPFDADFSDQKADKNIEDDLLSEPSMEYFLKLAVEGLKRVMDKGFTQCSRVSERKKEYERDNNSVLAWAEEVKAENDYDDNGLIRHFIETSVSELYGAYVGYLTQCGTKDRFKPTLQVFSKKMHESFNLISYRNKKEKKKVSYFKVKEPSEGKQLELPL